MEVDVPEKMVEWRRITGATALVHAIGDLACIVFYFLFRAGEYTVKFRALATGQPTGNTQQIDQFCARYVCLLKQYKLGTLHQLPPNAPSDNFLSVVSSTLCFSNQTNGRKNFCIHQEANRGVYFCATQALAQRLVYIHEHLSNRDTLLSAYCAESDLCTINNDTICGANNPVVGALKYPD